MSAPGWRIFRSARRRRRPAAANAGSSLAIARGTSPALPFDVRRLIAACAALMMLAAGTPVAAAAAPPCTACCAQVRVQAGDAPFAACCRLAPSTGTTARETQGQRLPGPAAKAVHPRAAALAARRDDARPASEFVNSRGLHAMRAAVLRI